MLRFTNKRIASCSSVKPVVGNLKAKYLNQPLQRKPPETSVFQLHFFYKRKYVSFGTETYFIFIYRLFKIISHILIQDIYIFTFSLVYVNICKLKLVYATKLLSLLMSWLSLQS